MSIALAVVLAQATILTPPATRQNAADIARIRAEVAAQPVPSGTVDNPTLVTDAEVGTPESAIRYARQAQEMSARDGVTTPVPSIAAITGPGCYKVAEHPYGHQLASSRALNGRSTIFQCTDFTADISVTDFSLPIKDVTAGGFPRSALKAIVNGGALTHWHRQSASGLRQAVFIWVGKTQAIEVGLDSRKLSLAALSAAGTAITEGVTRNR